MFKTKTLRTILIIFAVVTALGLTAGILGGLLSDAGSNSNSDVKLPDDKPTVCEHVFETVSSIAPTCSSVGSKTAKCTLCNVVETEEFPALAHTYNDYSICTVCRDTPHELICSNYVSSMTFYEDIGVLKIADWNGYQEDPGAFLVVFNEGTESEEAFYVLYDGSVASFMYNPVIVFAYRNGQGIVLEVSQLSSLRNIKTISVYQANPNFNFVQIECPDYGIDIIVDGKIVDFAYSDAIVLVNVSEITVSLFERGYDAAHIYLSDNSTLTAYLDSPVTITNLSHFEFINIVLRGK